MNEKKVFYKRLGCRRNLLEEFSSAVTQPHSFNVELTLILPLKENCLIERMLSGKLRFVPKSAMLIISNRYCFTGVSTLCCTHEMLTTPLAYEPSTRDNSQILAMS